MSLSEHNAGERATDNPVVIAGRLIKRGDGHYQIELVNGVMIDIPDDDCASIEESIDPITLRPTVTVTLKADKAVRATIQPHVFRVLSAANKVPFVFSGVKDLPEGDFILGLAYVSAARPVGGGGADHNTKVNCTNWMGVTQEDGTKGDGSNEPDEIFLP